MALLAPSASLLCTSAASGSRWVTCTGSGRRTPAQKSVIIARCRAEQLPGRFTPNCSRTSRFRLQQGNETTSTPRERAPLPRSRNEDWGARHHTSARQSGERSRKRPTTHEGTTASLDTLGQHRVVPRKHPPVNTEIMIPPYLLRARAIFFIMFALLLIFQDSISREPEDSRRHVPSYRDAKHGNANFALIALRTRNIWFRCILWVKITVPGCLYRTGVCF